MKTIPLAEVPADPDSAPELLVRLVQEAEAAAASDVHLQAHRDGVDVAFRLDGVLTPLRSVPGELGHRLLGRVKYLARLQTYQDSLPQDGRINRAELGAQCDVRVATYPTVTGEKAVLRLFREAEPPTLMSLGLETDTLVTLQNFLRQPAGLLLLTGPAGSGKTTTIYACLDFLRSLGGRHVITVEDPVEQILPGIMQTEVNEPRGLTFAAAARHLLRQDPQVLVLGEIRDDETANLAVRAALTGHLVLSTLHAGSGRGVLERLLVMVPDAFAVATATGLVVNQRLLRQVCAPCDGHGCATCLNTGFRGRVPLLELLPVDDEVRAALRERNVTAVTPARSLAAAARSLCERGVTTDAECRRVLGGERMTP